jgi:SynChlorMet cassette protein ScmD
MAHTDKLIANPLAVLREEFDDWAILFEPDTCRGFGLNPVGALIWKLLDGEHTVKDILHELRETTEDVPDGAEDHVNEFMAALTEQGLAGDEAETSKLLEQIPEAGRQASCCHRPYGAGRAEEDRRIVKYEKPELIDFTYDLRAAQGGAPCHTGALVGSGGKCQTGGNVGLADCASGSQAAGACNGGLCPGNACQTGACG